MVQRYCELRMDYRGIHVMVSNGSTLWLQHRTIKCVLLMLLICESLRIAMTITKLVYNLKHKSVGDKFSWYHLREKNI